MNKDSINTIGCKQNSREDAILSSLNDVEGLTEILEKNFEDWSDFDKWKNTSAQRWIFARAMEICKGRKIDLRCNCCEYNYVIQSDFKNNLNQSCYGIKIAYIIEKIVDEIILAKASRENDGTYFS